MPGIRNRNCQRMWSVGCPRPRLLTPGVNIHRVLTPGGDIQYRWLLQGWIYNIGPLSLHEAWPGPGDYLGPHSGSWCPPCRGRTRCPAWSAASCLGGTAAYSVTQCDIGWRFSVIQCDTAVCDIVWHSVTYCDIVWHNVTLGDIDSVT